MGTHYPYPNPYPLYLGRVWITHLNLDMDRNTIGIVEQFKLLVFVVLGLCKPGRGRKRISKGSGNRNMEESIINCQFLPLELDTDICLNVFLMPPIPTVLRCSFLFLRPAKLV
ncbi:hypothetical protein PVAP13_2KG234316 [Panicum virgatum]|uniref:Uncharacterized protein n=1 Tax=Panicum virgatum TaxID=38727 RepID=A0A8T0W2Y6_PANVG|nr:hypothetical protein PVAP13_2KG234316 [Panicum virgatum]